MKKFAILVLLALTTSFSVATLADSIGYIEVDRILLSFNKNLHKISQIT